MDCRYLLLFWDLPFYSLNSIFWRTEVLNFIVVQLSNILLLVLFCGLRNFYLPKAMKILSFVFL